MPTLYKKHARIFTNCYKAKGDNVGKDYFIFRKHWKLRDFVL